LQVDGWVKVLDPTQHKIGNFRDSGIIVQLSVCLLAELDVQCCRCMDSSKFVELSKLTKLQSLNLYRTVVDLHSMLAIVRLLRNKTCMFMVYNLYSLL